MIRSFLAAAIAVSVAGAGHAKSAGRPYDFNANDAPPMSAIAASSLLASVCEAGAGDKNPAAKARALGLKAAQAEAEFSWALVDGARVWNVATRDSRVMVYAYGPDASKCGVIVGRPIPGAVAERVTEDLQSIGGYAQIDASTMPGDVMFTRLFSQDSGRYVDILEYPARANAPGVLKLELLTN